MEALRSSISICLLLLFSAWMTVHGYSIPRSDADDDLLIRQIVSDADIASENEEAILGAEGQFFRFLKKFGKSYATPAEHGYRFSVFKANLRRAKRHQLLDPTAVHGINQFSDLTPEEFERNYLGLHRRKPSMFSKVGSGAHEAPILPTNDLPENFDWRDQGAVTPVKNQVYFFSFSFKRLFRWLFFIIFINRAHRRVKYTCRRLVLYLEIYVC